MGDRSFMAQYGAQLVDNGYSVIPIRPGEKAPWQGLSRWQQYCTRLPTDQEIEQWSNYPGAGIGIACGNVIGIDIDVSDGALSQRIAELARLRLGDTPALRIGNHPKQLLIYRAETPFASFDAKPLQVLALGRQFVGYGFHPDTGHPYQWPLGSLTDIDMGTLPSVSESQVRAWMAEAVKLLPANIRPPEPRNASAGSWTPKEPATYEAVESALEAVPSDAGTSRQSWIEIGMAIKAGLGEDGIHLWHEWSARDVSRYTAKECDVQWRSFKMMESGIGVGTLFDRASLHGWHPEPGIYLYAHEKEAAAGINIDFAAIVANALARSKKAQPVIDIEQIDDNDQAAPKYTVPAGDPWWLRDLDGALRMFVDYTRSQSHRDQPLLALAVSLPVFGTMAGRRYKTETGLLSNLYTVGIGGSSSGKEMGINVATRLFNEARLANMLGGEELASGRAIISTLREKPTCFFALDEFGKMLQRVASKYARSSNDADIFKVMLSMFSASQRVYGGVEYADKTVKKTEPISNPCLSIYGPTVPGNFWSALSSGEAVDGTLARMLVFESECSYPDQRRVYQREIPEDLVEMAKRIANGAYDHTTFPLGDGFSASPNPFVVRMDTGATGRDDELMTYQDELLRKHEGMPGESIYGRMREIILKVALIYAVTLRPGNPVITVPVFDWAAQLVIDRVEHMVKAIQLNVADNEQEAAVKRVLRIISDAGKAGITKNNLTRKTQFLKGREREDIIRDLIEGGQTRAEQITPMNGKPKTVYFET